MTRFGSLSVVRQKATPRLVPFALMALAALFAAAANAQTFNASVSGIVSDPTGAVAPNVKVTVTDIARGTQYSASTNQDGVYLIKNLIPSTYKVTAVAAGFQAYVVNTFPLTATQQAVLNITLQLGTANQTVEVSSQVQMIEPSNATLGGLVNSKSIADLPLVNRNILTLMVLEPGVAPSTPNNYQSNFFTSAIRYSFNGGMESTNDFQLDGMSILNQSDIPGIMGLTMLPSVDSVQEMKLQTNSYSAVYGRSGGGITTMVTKSGTNAFHGDLFEFLRNNDLNANSFFSNRSGAAIAPLKINQFGGSIGGPIVKNKAFFFGLLEKDTSIQGGFSLFTVPTAAERAGDFSQDLNSAGQQKVIYNPYSTPATANSAGQYIRTPFVGNVIPTSMINPVGAKAATYWPSPNLPGSTYTGQNNVGETASATNPLWQNTEKVDYNFSETKRAFIRYTYLYNVAGSPNYFSNLADEGYGPMTVHSHNAAVGYTQTFGSATVLDLRAGVNRFSAFRPSNGLGFKLTDLGMPQGLQTFLEQGDVDEFPGIGVTGYSTLGNNNGPYYSSHQLNYNVSGTLSRVIGKHTVTVGGEHRDYYLNFVQTNPLVMNFGPDMTQGPDARTVSAIGGDAAASMLLGAGDSGSATFYAHPANANHYFSEFVQDDFKWSRRLTINIGFRLDEETGTTERYNRMAAINPYVLNPISNQVTNPFTGQTPWNLYGGYVFPGSGPDTFGSRAIRSLEVKPNPRIGIAYSLNDKTVIRAGYGIFYGVPYAGATREFNGATFQTTTTWVPSLGNDGIHPTNLISNPFPSGYLYPPGSSQGLLSVVGQALNSAYAPTLKTLYNQQWNFAVQRSLATDMMLQVAYVGNKGTHLPYSGGGDMDQLAPNYSSLGNQLNTLVNNPFYGNSNITSGPLAQPQIKYGQLLLPFPEWQSVGTDGTAVGNSEYESLQASFTKRFASGVSLISSYTWSKLMTDIANGTWAGAAAIRSYYCIRCEHSPSTYDVPHRFTLSAVGELPFGKGKKFGSNWNPVIDAFLGGWQANGIVTLASGQPLALTTATNNSYTFGGGQFPDLVGNPVLSSGKSIYEWFNPAAFAQPANFTSGNMSRTYTGVRTDWTRNLDFSLFKNFHVTERFQLQFRAEAFNLTNSVVFSAPGTTVGGANFGVVTGQSNTPRNIQLALKLLF
jgi:hypothetical protein